MIRIETPDTRSHTKYTCDEYTDARNMERVIQDLAH